MNQWKGACVVAIFFRSWMDDIGEKPICYLLSLFLLAVGIACGLFFPRFLSVGDQAAIVEETATVVEATVKSSLSVKGSLLSSLWTNTRIALVIAFAGGFWFGAPFALIAQAVKGFGMGIFLYAITAGYGGLGSFAGLLYLLPQSIFYLAGYTTLCACSLHRSMGRLRGNKIPRSQYLLEVLPPLLGIGLGIVVECTISPFILKMAGPIL